MTRPHKLVRACIVRNASFRALWGSMPKRVFVVVLSFGTGKEEPDAAAYGAG